MHVVAVNTQTFPLMTKLLLDALDLPPAVVDGQRHLSIQRVFRGTEPTPINATVFPNGSASFSDIWDVQATNIYRIGCDPALISVPPSEDEMCIDNCDFEVRMLSFAVDRRSLIVWRSAADEFLEANDALR